VDGGATIYKVDTGGPSPLHVLEFSRYSVYRPGLDTEYEAYEQHSDADGYTLDLDVSRDFTTSSLPLTITKKNVTQRVPVVYRHTVWKSDQPDDIYIAGGIFWDNWGKDESEFFTKEEDIPDFSIWRFNLERRQWWQVPFENISGGRPVIRTWAGAGESVPALNRSFYLGYATHIFRL
jgi:hypothetical protein